MNSSRSSNEPAGDNRTTRRQCSNHVSNATSSKSLGDRRALSLDRTNCEKCNQTSYTPEFLSDVKRFHILGFLYLLLLFRPQESSDVDVQTQCSDCNDVHQQGNRVCIQR